MAWIVVLVASGLLESAWASSLKASEDFPRLWPSIWSADRPGGAR